MRSKHLIAALTVNDQSSFPSDLFIYLKFEFVSLCLNSSLVTRILALTDNCGSSTLNLKNEHFDEIQELTIGSLSLRFCSVLNEFWFMNWSLYLFICRSIICCGCAHEFVSVAVKRQTKGGCKDIGFLEMLRKCSMFLYNIGILTARLQAWKYCWLLSCWEPCSGFSVLQRFLLLIILLLLHLGIFDHLCTEFSVVNRIFFFFFAFW